MKIGFVPKKTKSNLLFELYTPQIAGGGGVPPTPLLPKTNNLSLKHVCVR